MKGESMILLNLLGRQGRKTCTPGPAGYTVPLLYGNFKSHRPQGDYCGQRILLQ